MAELAEVGVLDLVADEGARNANLIATNDDDLLAGKELLGNDRGKATKKVVAAVDNNSFRHLDDSSVGRNMNDERWKVSRKNNLLNPLVVRSKAIKFEVRLLFCRHASKKRERERGERERLLTDKASSFRDRLQKIIAVMHLCIISSFM